MPVTSRQQAKPRVVDEKSPNRTSATDRKNGHAPAFDKAWEAVPDNDLHKCMHQILTVLLSYDRKNILSQVQSSPEKWDISIARIEQKISAREYSSMADYQNDINRLFKNVSQTLDANLHEPLTSLYKLAQNVIRIETKRLNVQTSEEDSNHSESATVEKTGVADSDTAMGEATEDNAADSNGTHAIPATLQDEQVHKALFQVTADGYIFSDMSKAPHWIGEVNDSEPLPPNYKEVIIHPSSFTEQDIGSLKQAAPNHSEQHRRVDRYEQRMVPVEMLDYGAFASFAPKYDSNSATISLESTYLAGTSKQAWRQQQKERARKFYGETTLDSTWLKEQGLDPEAILHSLEVDDESQLEHTGDMATTIEQNAHLLKRLADLQNERFNQHGEAGGSVSKQELKIASILEQRLQGAMAQLAPKDLVDPNTVERAMQRIPTKDPVFRGTLPPTKLFAFTTDEHKASNVSPYTGHTGARQINANNTLRNR